MIAEPNSDLWDEAVIAKGGSPHGRRRCGTPIISTTRFDASAVHSLDPIEGWLPVDGTLEVPCSS